MGKEAPPYRRILLKLSGEALIGNGQFGIDPEELDRLAREIAEVVNQDIEMGVVIGGGNLFRGAALSKAGLGRITGDHMGMLATVMNALALRDALERIDLHTRIMSSIPMSGVVEHYDRRKALDHLSKKHVVIFSGGTGNPLFTTDTAACLRAIEVDCDVVIKATKVDGVFSADPEEVPDATKYERITYDDVLTQKLGVMDLTAICLCRDHDMPLRVFNVQTPGALCRVVNDIEEGSLVTGKQ